MNNFAYKKFLLFIKQDMDEIKKKFKLNKKISFFSKTTPVVKRAEKL